jgi:hypothetical protein
MDPLIRAGCAVWKSVEDGELDEGRKGRSPREGPFCPVGWLAGVDFFDFSTIYPLVRGLVAMYNAGRLT